MSTPRSDSPHADVTLTPSPHSHYDNVRDAVTKGPVQDCTEIAALHTFGTDALHDQLLKNFTRIAEPAVPCRVRIDNGEWVPASPAEAAGSFQLYMTYNHLVRNRSCLLDGDFTDEKTDVRSTGAT